MIVIQVELASISLFSLGALIINVAPCVLGFVLGINYYNNLRSIQIPALLTSSALILSILAHIMNICASYKIISVSINTGVGALLTGSVLYFLGEYAADAIEVGTDRTVVVNTCIAFFSWGAIYLSKTAGHVASMEKDAETNSSRFMFEKPAPLESPIPNLSPNLSWASTINSFDFSDPPMLTPPTVPSSHIASHPTSPKPPKSPLKLHLSKSSFSLKRQGSKVSMVSTPKIVSPQLPTVVPEFPETHNWVIIPNENVTDSRSVSGSSQLTGRVFPAAEYNRRLNSAGFEKDEPVVLNLRTLPRQR